MAEPWWPPLEANQGAISILALVVALVAFVVELHRANTQRQRELEQEIEEAIFLIEDLEDILFDDSLEAEFGDQHVKTIADALRSLAVAHVKKPTLAMPLLSAARIADDISRMDSKEARAEADELADQLSSLKSFAESALADATRRIVRRRAERRKAQKAVSALVRQRARRQ